jgi:DNA-directed RNA polymerase specialized sigma24 family protein
LINWLSKLAERQILTAAAHYGTRKRDKKREVLMSEAAGRSDGDDTVPFELEDSTRAPLERLSEAEQTAIVESAIHQLPEEMRELIILRDYAGASWDTVAHETGRPSAAAARMMHTRALMELGKRVRRKGLL